MGTNVVIYPTNGNLQSYSITNATTFTLGVANTSYVETVRLSLFGSNVLTWTTLNLSNAAAAYASNITTELLFDHSVGATNWWLYRLR